MRRAAVLAVCLLAAGGGSASADYRPEIAVQDEAQITCGMSGQRSAALSAARMLGATTIRINAIENMPAHFGCDPVMATLAVAGAGFRPQVTVIGDVQWARYLARSVGRYVRTWSVWNEPNLSGWQRGGMDTTSPHTVPVTGNPWTYRRLYLRVARALRRTDRGREHILIGELAASRARNGFLSDMTSRRSRTVRADGFALHPYAWARGVQRAGGLRRYLRGWRVELRRLARQRRLCRPGRGCRPVPIFITESGYFSQPRDGVYHPPEVQARALPRTWRIACRAGVRQMLHYQLRDNGQASWDTSLLDESGAPRPQFDALAGYLRSARGCA
jgi:hypothetical protein